MNDWDLTEREAQMWSHLAKVAGFDPTRSTPLEKAARKKVLSRVVKTPPVTPLDILADFCGELLIAKEEIRYKGRLLALKSGIVFPRYSRGQLLGRLGHLDAAKLAMIAERAVIIHETHTAN